MKPNHPPNIFYQGPIPGHYVADEIDKHSRKTGIGAHSLFLGQVRADQIGDRQVQGIEYTAYEEMAMEKMGGIREDIIQKHGLTCLHVHHSLGKVRAGEICLFVLTSSAHRAAAIEACNELVEIIKSQLPIWGQELLDDSTHQWKINQ